MTQFYIYTHSRPDGTVFYVGKGTMKRSMKLSRPENPHHMNVVKKYGRENIIVRRHLCGDESQAFILERMMISGYRSSGTLLVNMTDGGEGASGHKASDETKAKMSAVRKGKKASIERVQAIKDAFTPERRAVMSDLHKGKPKSDSSKLKISLSKTGVKREPFSEDWLGKMSAAQKGRKASPETRAKMTQRMIERNAAMTPEQKSIIARKASLKAAEAMKMKTPEEIAIITEKKRQGSLKRWANRKHLASFAVL